MLLPALIGLAALLSTGSAAGAIPLGVFVVSDKTTSTIAAGLNLLKSVMPSNAFFGKGCEAGLFLTDEQASQVCKGHHRLTAVE